MTRARPASHAGNDARKTPMLSGTVSAEVEAHVRNVAEEVGLPISVVMDEWLRRGGGLGPPPGGWREKLMRGTTPGVEVARLCLALAGIAQKLAGFALDPAAGDVLVTVARTVAEVVRSAKAEAES